MPKLCGIRVTESDHTSVDIVHISSNWPLATFVSVKHRFGMCDIHSICSTLPKTSIDYFGHDKQFLTQKKKQLYIYHWHLIFGLLGTFSFGHVIALRITTRNSLYFRYNSYDGTLVGHRRCISNQMQQLTNKTYIAVYRIDPRYTHSHVHKIKINETLNWWGCSIVMNSWLYLSME